MFIYEAVRVHFCSLIIFVGFQVFMGEDFDLKLVGIFEFSQQFWS